MDCGWHTIVFPFRYRITYTIYTFVYRRVVSLSYVLYSVFCLFCILCVYFLLGIENCYVSGAFSHLLFLCTINFQENGKQENISNEVITWVIEREREKDREMCIQVRICVNFQKLHIVFNWPIYACNSHQFRIYQSFFRIAHFLFRHSSISSVQNCFICVFRSFFGCIGVAVFLFPYHFTLALCRRLKI